MIRITVSILKDELLFEREVRIATKTLVNKGMEIKRAQANALESVSDVQCTYTVSSKSKDVVANDIINDVAQKRPYRVIVTHI